MKGRSRKIDTVEVPYVTDQRKEYVGLTVNIPVLYDKRLAAPTVD